MDLWSPEQTKKIIGIEQAFEEFCEADPELGRLDRTRPDPKCNPKKFKKWYARYCPVQDDATERFVELFREKILVAIVLQDDKEIVLPPEYWASPLASLTITAGKVRGQLHDDLGHLENSRVVLHKDDWEKWVNSSVSDSQRATHEPVESLTPEPPDKVAKPPGRGGRKPGSGAYTAQDYPLWKKMKTALDRGDAMSPWGAAGPFAEDAHGAGHPDSKRRRLATGYKRWIVTQ